MGNGWGECDTLSPSQRITARAELDRVASTLADAVGEHRRAPTTGNTERMYEALDVLLEARRQVLYG